MIEALPVVSVPVLSKAKVSTAASVSSAPPHVHYLALRLNAARRKVIETRLAFADIAALTGFNSASAFARSYRAHFRESASETRRRLRSGSGLVA